MPSPSQATRRRRGAEPVADRQHVGERLARVVDVGQAVDDGIARPRPTPRGRRARACGSRSRRGSARALRCRRSTRRAKLQLARAQGDAAPPSWVMPTSKETRVRVEGLWKMRPSDRPAERRRRARLQVEARSSIAPISSGTRSGPSADCDPQARRSRHSRRPPLRRRQTAAATSPGGRPRRRLERPGAHRLRPARARRGTGHLRHEQLGGVGRAQQRIGDGRGEPLAVELEPVDQHGERAERAADVAPRREERRLVLLEVLVVRERQPLDRRAIRSAGRSPFPPCRARARRRRG